jgi:hypothetical protein
VLWQKFAAGDWIMISLTVSVLLLIFGLMTLADVCIEAYRRDRHNKQILRYHQEHFDADKRLSKRKV